MPRDVSQLLSRFSLAQSEKDREVVAVRILSKRGVGRAEVLMPGCEGGSVVATAPTPIACGSSAQAIVNRTTGAVTILPGPAAGPGRAAVFPARVRGSEVAPVAGPTAVYLITALRFGEVEYRAISAEGEDLGFIGSAIPTESAGRHIFPPAADGLGEGVRIAVSGGELVTMDLLTGDTYTYTPDSPWIVSAPQMVGDSIYWWETQFTESATSSPVRLIKSDSAKWMSPEVVASGNATRPGAADWGETRGPDFDTSHAAVWQHMNDGQDWWRRISAPLGGGSISQDSSTDGLYESDLPPSVLRAGYPLSATVSVTFQSLDSPPDEGDAKTVSVIDPGDPDDVIAAWASVGSALDVSPDPQGVGVYILKADRIERRNLGGGLISEVLLVDAPYIDLAGLAVLETPIVLPPEEEDE
jgi:hypothetical protein